MTLSKAKKILQDIFIRIARKDKPTNKDYQEQEALAIAMMLVDERIENKII